MPIEMGFVLTTMKTEIIVRQAASGFLKYHRWWTRSDGLLTARGGVYRLQKQGDLDELLSIRRKIPPG